MRILEELQAQFQGYVWKHVLSMLLGLMLLKGPGRRPVVYLILDDTVVPKRGLHLPQLGFHFCPAQDRVVRGWDLVFAALRVGQLTVPWTWHCYVNERFTQEEDFRKRTELAAKLVEEFEPPWPARVVVLAAFSRLLFWFFPLAPSSWLPNEVPSS